MCLIAALRLKLTLMGDTPLPGKGLRPLHPFIYCYTQLNVCMIGYYWTRIYPILAF